MSTSLLWPWFTSRSETPLPPDVGSCISQEHPVDDAMADLPWHLLNSVNRNCINVYDSCYQSKCNAQNLHRVISHHLYRLYRD